MVDGVTVAMSVMAAALPVIFSHGLGEGPPGRCRRWHHGDDGTRFGGKCRGPAGGGPAARAVLRRGAGPVGLGAAPGGGGVAPRGGGSPAAGLGAPPPAARAAGARVVLGRAGAMP